MAKTNIDFQQYANSGDIKSMYIAGTAAGNKVATIDDIPIDYLVYSNLDTKAAEGSYTAIYIGGVGPKDKAATEQYVDDIIQIAGNYSDTDTTRLLESGELTKIYLGGIEDFNLVATKYDILNTGANYGDSNVQTYLSSGTVTDILIHTVTGSAVKVATLDDLIYNESALPKLALTEENTQATYVPTVAYSGYRIYLTAAGVQTIELDSSILPVGYQIEIHNTTIDAINITMISGTINGSAFLNGQIAQYGKLSLVHWKLGTWSAT